jgi:SAM-dependent methyltransferase
MCAVTDERTEAQAVVDRYFDAVADYWTDVYGERGLQGQVYRRRMETALGWIDELNLDPGTPVLEVGCGAGFVSTELARRGLAVTGVDSSAAMVELLQRRALETGLDGRVHALVADVHGLPFDPDRFQVLVALGVLPWLHDPGAAVAEMIRVVSPGGWLILTADNRARLNLLTEPRENALLTPILSAYQGLKRLRGWTASRTPSYLHLPREVDAMLTAAGAMPVRRTTVGYGPFTLRDRPVLPNEAGRWLHHRLQLASRERPSLRRTGWHYIVAAQKPATTAGEGRDGPR